MATLLIMGIQSDAREYYTTELKFMVSPTDLKARMSNEAEDFVIIDVRDAASYERGHIKGAISMPASQIPERYSELPNDKELIVYCWSHSCMLSTKAGLAFAEHGVHVKELNVGWDEWSEWQYPAEGTDVNWTTDATPVFCEIGSETC